MQFAGAWNSNIVNDREINEGNRVHRFSGTTTSASTQRGKMTRRVRINERAIILFSDTASAQIRANLKVRASIKLVDAVNPSRRTYASVSDTISFIANAPTFRRWKAFSSVDSSSTSETLNAVRRLPSRMMDSVLFDSIMHANRLRTISSVSEIALIGSIKLQHTRMTPPQIMRALTVRREPREIIVPRERREMMVPQ